MQTETEKLGFSVKHLFGHVKRSQLSTGQIWNLEVEGNRNCARPMKWWLDAIEDDLRQRNLQAENC